MPPKGGQQKAKAAPARAPPSTPVKSKPKPPAKPAAQPETDGGEQEAREPETPSKSAKKTPAKTPVKTPRRQKQPQTVEFALLKDNKAADDEAAAAAIIEVSVGNVEPHAEPKKKGGGYEKLIKLESANKFEILRSFMLTEGPDEGCQVILVRPAKPFDFLGLPKAPRARIFEFYFAHDGTVDRPITLDGKRKGLLNDIYAKTYSNDSKHRVGLLAVNKEIHAEAIPVFYHLPIRFESTSSVMDFMSQVDTSVRTHIVNIHIKTYQKNSARNALSLLADCKNLKCIHFEAGVFSEGDPQKCAKSLYADAHKFLHSFGATKGNKEAGVDILSFGKNALVLKDDGKSTKPWPEHMLQEMKESLKAKLK